MVIPDPNTGAQAVYQEVRERAFDQAIGTYDEYVDLVEEVINEKVNVGELSQHDDWEQLRKDLMLKWPELESEIAAAPG